MSNKCFPEMNAIFKSVKTATPKTAFELREEKRKLNGGRSFFESATPLGSYNLTARNWARSLYTEVRHVKKGIKTISGIPG